MSTRMTDAEIDFGLATKLFSYSNVKIRDGIVMGAPTPETGLPEGAYSGMSSVAVFSDQAVTKATRWAFLLLVKKWMNERGYWFSLRDAGDGKNVDACWFWAKDWRRDGRCRGPIGEEPRIVCEAALKALETEEPK